MISVKNHQMPPTILVEAARGFRSDPCCIRVPTVNQKLFARVKSFCTTNPVSTQGWGLDHSIGENLRTNESMQSDYFSHILI